MKRDTKPYFFLLITFFTVQKLAACDMCGCFMGIMPSDKRSFAGMYYRYRSFSGDGVKNSAMFPEGSMRISHSDHEKEDMPSEDFELYRAVELRARYYLHPRLELNAVFPYLMNNADESGIQTSVNGIGDLSLLLGWQVIDEAETGKFRHRLLAGTGVKLATGISDVKSKDGDRYPLLLQGGTGTNDWLTYLTYQVSFDNFGLNLTPLYKVNGENRFEEKIDNSFTSSASLFYRFSVGENIKILPSAQAYYEFTNGVYVKEVLMESTRMNLMMCGPGIDIYRKNLGLSVSSLFSCYEEESSSGLKNRIRLMLGLNFYFDQSVFIF